MPFEPELPDEYPKPLSASASHHVLEPGALKLTGQITREAQDTQQVLRLLQLEREGVQLTEDARAQIRAYRLRSGN